tara:strand:+ start:308 stop:784 length:477 start_codon:yes stop_codon:yes gene_type:complete
MYAKIKDGSVEKYPYSITDLKQDNPNVSFPKVLDSTVLNSFGMYEVVTDSKPTYNIVTQVINKKSTPELVSEVWTLKWEIKDKSQEEIDEIKAREQEDIRFERTSILMNCDWTIIADAPLSTDMVAKWKTYRQELRDITKQASFNNDQPSVTWPNQPK